MLMTKERNESNTTYNQANSAALRVHILFFIPLIFSFHFRCIRWEFLHLRLIILNSSSKETKKSLLIKDSTNTQSNTSRHILGFFHLSLLFRYFYGRYSGELHSLVRPGQTFTARNCQVKYASSLPAYYKCS